MLLFQIARPFWSKRITKSFPLPLLSANKIVFIDLCSLPVKINYQNNFYIKGH